MTDAEILMLVAYTAEVWPQNYVLPTGPALDVRVQVWRDFVGDLDAAVVRAAIGDAGGEKFPPSPGELRERALRFAGVQLPPDPHVAIAEILAAVARVGYVGAPEWSHPAIGAAVAAFGGWQQVCQSTNPEALRAHLLKLYGSALLRSMRAETLAPSFAELIRPLDKQLDEQAAIGPPAESVSALRSPETERDNAEGLRQVAQTRRAIDPLATYEEEE